ncbi:MAG: hypothetical protein WA188_08895 [Terriglobales bacterium]
MTKRALHPEQWQILRRLEAAGCPVDCERLPQGSYPLRVLTERSRWGTDIFPLPQGTGIALRLNIIVTASLTICQLHLRADWLGGEISWFKPCVDHFRRYCFHECAYGTDIRFSFDEVLNERMSRWQALSRGSHLRGFLIGAAPDVLASTMGAELEARLVIEDLFGEEYPFLVKISNSKEVTRPPSTSLSDGEVI